MSVIADLEGRAQQDPGGVALRHKRRGVWEETTWARYRDGVRRVAGGLRALGAGEGDRIGLMTHNRPEWVLAHLAALGLGATPEGLDATAESVALDGPFAAVVVEDEEQLDKARAAGFDGRLVVLEARGIRGFGDDERLIPWETVAGAEPADLRDTPVSAEPGLPVREGDQILSFLPMHTAAERGLSVAGAVHHGVTVHFGEGVFTQDLREVQPTLLTGPPVLWERMHQEVEQRMGDASWLKRRAYASALGNGTFGDVLALRALREKLGLARARLLVSTGPVEPATRTWFDRIGRPLQEGVRGAPEPPAVHRRGEAA